MSALPQDAPRGFVSKQEHYAALRRIDELEAELAEMRERLTECRGEAYVPRLIAMGIQISGARPVALLLASNQPVPMAPLIDAATPTFSKRSRDCIPVEILRTQLCRARKQLEALGCQPPVIRSLSRWGYEITPEARLWLLERVGG